MEEERRANVPAIIFKSHARRHAPATGLTSDEIEPAITKDLRRAEPAPGVPFHRVLIVGAIPVKDNGIHRTDTEAIEVGSYVRWTRRGRGVDSVRGEVPLE